MEHTHSDPNEANAPVVEETLEQNPARAEGNPWALAAGIFPDDELTRAWVAEMQAARQRDEDTTDLSPQHLCLDKGYDNEPVRKVVAERGYREHIRRIGEEKDEGDQKTHPARRRVAERTFSWLSRWRGLLVRWDKKPQNYLANVKLACALLWMRRAHQAGSPLLGQTVTIFGMTSR